MMNSVFKKHSQWYRHEVIYPFVLTFILAGFMPGLAKALAPQLQEKVTVSDRLVTLGDLFKEASLQSHAPLFRSPDPGTTGKISVQRILTAAKKHGLKLLQRPDFSMVTISRSSRLIELAVLKDRIRDRLEGKYASMDAKSQLVITIANQTKDLHLDASVQGQLDLSSIDWSARSQRFTARFDIPGSDTITLRGSASLMIEAGVAKHNIARGKPLVRADLELNLVKSGGRRTQRYASIDEMIGLSAKRSLQAGKPISLTDLEAPVLIHKNQLVTILLEIPGLVIRAEGKALASASKGEAVKVLNTQSKRIIHATARASGLVSVSLKQSFGSGT